MGMEAHSSIYRQPAIFRAGPEPTPVRGRPPVGLAGSLGPLRGAQTSRLLGGRPRCPAIPLITARSAAGAPSPVAVAAGDRTHLALARGARDYPVGPAVNGGQGRAGESTPRSLFMSRMCFSLEVTMRLLDPTRKSHCDHESAFWPGVLSLEFAANLSGVPLRNLR